MMKAKIILILRLTKINNLKKKKKNVMKSAKMRQIHHKN